MHLVSRAFGDQVKAFCSSWGFSRTKCHLWFGGMHNLLSNNPTSCSIHWHKESFKNHVTTKKARYKVDLFALQETKYVIKIHGLMVHQYWRWLFLSASTKTHNTCLFLYVLLQRVDSDAAYINQIYSLSAHVWKSLEDDLDVYDYLSN